MKHRGLENRFEQVEFDLTPKDARRPIDEVVTRINKVKPTFTKPAPDALREEIFENNDFLIEALAD